MHQPPSSGFSGGVALLYFSSFFAFFSVSWTLVFTDEVPRRVTPVTETATAKGKCGFGAIVGIGRAIWAWYWEKLAVGRPFYLEKRRVFEIVEIAAQVQVLFASALTVDRCCCSCRSLFRCFAVGFL